jgi:hypothetical protein
MNFPLYGNKDIKESSCVLLGKNWEVLDADKKNKNNRYFINMCNDLLIEGDAAVIVNDSTNNNKRTYTFDKVLKHTCM